jgi:hypothetical protein
MARSAESGRGRRYGLEVLNKSAIVLITAFWEAYYEDLATEALEHLVTNADSVEKLPLELKKRVASELRETPTNSLSGNAREKGVARCPSIPSR